VIAAGGEWRPVGDVCRHVGIAEQTFYRWKKAYGEMLRSETPRAETGPRGKHALEARHRRSAPGHRHGFCQPSYLITCDALFNDEGDLCLLRVERAFKDFGLPKADNGVPFSSPNALYGLSKPSVWWLRLGLEIERVKPDILSRTSGMNACISR
jgi:hypothetical protein